MRYRNPQQNRRLHQLLQQLGIDEEQKLDMVSSYTNGRTTSSSQMYWHECQNLINFLNAQASGKADVADRKRKRVISQMRQAGYVTATGKADMRAIEAWVLKTFKKPFNSLSTGELSKVIVASENVKKHYLSKL